MNRVEELRILLKKANNLYRDGNPIMSDAEYDLLENELRVLKPEDEWFKRGVNDEKPKDREYVLPYPMMSLDKVKRPEDIIAWAKKYPSNATFIITPKYDGLSVGMKGDIAWTRGDGIVGQNCSNHVRSIYLKPESSEYVVRGEIIIDNVDWNQFKAINENAKSQRNSATGLINGDYDENRKEEYGLLRIMPYEIMDVAMDKEEQLKELGNQNYVKISNLTKLTEEYLLQLFVSWKKIYPIDGLVIDVNEIEYRQGVEANGNPSFSIAYKHSSFSEVANGIIDRIERNVNRMGVITPVVWLKEPINLAGADIQRVSAINMRYIYEWGLYPNEVVTIIRSGEVIPKIIGVGDSMIPFREEFDNIHEYEDVYNHTVSERQKSLPDDINNREDIKILDKCPICGECLMKVIDFETGIWHEMVCNNPECEGKQYASVVKFFEICGIDGFSDKTFYQLMNSGLIEKNWWEVFNLRPEDLLSLDGWGEKSVEKFFSELEKIRTTLPFARFLHATGWFSDLGEKTLQKIIDADGWGKDDYELVEIEGVQQITADKFLSGFYVYSKMEDIVQHFFKFAYIKTPQSEGKLKGLVICATGFRDQALFNKIKENGGTIADSLTKSVNCLIVKDLNSKSSKVQKAEKNGIEILDINEFMKKYMA